MTVIAFDGKTLAADRQNTCECMSFTVRKIARTEDGILLAAAGKGTHAMQLLRWALEGFTAPYPICPDKDNYADLWRIEPDGKILVYQNAPEPLRYLDPTFVAGCGREAAAGAMLMGADARRAVEVACQVNIYCGGGIDILELSPEIAPCKT